MISGERRANNANRAITNGLIALHIPVPLTTVQWADKYYYLPKESSYTPGKWETLPFQVAIMNAMGYELIRVVNLIKSARVGYTKMLLGVEGYFIEHKSRNSLLFQPTDSSAEDFMKSHVEPTIRDVPVLLELAPWFGRKHRDNTLTLKRFSSGVGFWCLGGAAAKNYREKSVDVVCYDELSSFEPDVEKEGSPTLLGDKRIEGSVWPKSIRGSTPKVKGACQIEKAANESAHFMRFHVPCPHCGEEQYLKFGDGSTPFGLKWEKSKPETVYYLCEHNGCVIRQSELDQKAGRWICDNTGMWTRDGLAYFSASGEEVPPPRSITFHIWTAYSPFTTWIQIIYDWLDALKDPNGVKTFINTTLGEPYEEAVAEKLSHELLLEKVIHYAAPVPERVVYLTAGIDSQRNRYEMYVWGWAKRLSLLISKLSWDGMMMKIPCSVWMPSLIKNIVMLTGRIFPFPVSAGISAVSMQKSSINAQKNTAFSACCLSKGPPFTENPLLPCLKNATRAGYSCAKSVLILPKKCFTPEWGRLLRLPTKPRLMRSAFRIIRMFLRRWKRSNW